MTPSQRQTIRDAIDQHTRRQLHAQRVIATQCEWCGTEIPDTANCVSSRRFCTDLHRRAWSTRYGRWVPL